VNRHEFLREEIHDLPRSPFNLSALRCQHSWEGVILPQLSFLPADGFRVDKARQEWTAPDGSGQKEGAHLNAFEIKVTKYEEIQAVELSGPLVLGLPVNNLRQKIDNLVAHGTNQFVFNLTGVNRMDSSGIGLLVMIMSSTKEAGGALKLVNPSKQVIQTLKMCNLLPLFEVFSEEQEAISSFAKS
jgi:anti-sigma B factor antagonist